MSLNFKTFILIICCSVIFCHSLVYGQQSASSNNADYVIEFNKTCEQLSSDPYNAELYAKLKALFGKLPDINEQCRCAAIYYLAMSLAGNSAEASEAMRFIEKKNPDSAYLRRLSANNFSEDCSGCNGGEAAAFQCKTCGGSGRCSMCKGNGSRPGRGNKPITCAGCMGNGKCKQCAGTGHTAPKCQKCGGIGKTLSVQGVKNEYLALLNEKSGKQSHVPATAGQDEKR